MLRIEDHHQHVCEATILESQYGENWDEHNIQDGRKGSKNHPRMSLVAQRYLPIRRTLSLDHIDGANKQFL